MEDICRYERAIKSMTRVLSEDFSRRDFLAVDPIQTPEKSGRQRAVSYAEGSNPLKSSSRDDIYAGVWGGLDLHSSPKTKSLLSPSLPQTPKVRQLSTDETVYNLASTGIPPKYLKSAGYYAEELRLGGYSASQLIGAGMQIRFTHLTI